MEEKEKQVAEDKARDIDPDAIDFKHPAKKEHAAKNENISEWHQKNDISQTLYQENSDASISQIDEGTVALQEEKLEEKEEKTTSDNSDNQDDKNSTTDWDAEKNRSGRRK